MNSYFKHQDSNQVDCYFELDKKNTCLRAVFISEVFDDYKNLFYIEDEQYHLPDSFSKKELDKMHKIFKPEFETQWNRNYSDSNSITFLQKQAIFKRNN
ncbi:MAG: hypothetical protein ACPG6B_05655 [Oceanihabitans sp.]